MRKVFETRKRLLAVGLAGALVLALSVMGGLLLGSSSAHAQTPSPTPAPVPASLPVVTLAHLNPNGSDFTGNPFCPQTVWSATGARVVSVVAWHDCNNAVGLHHVIRTGGYDATTTVVGKSETEFEDDGGSACANGLDDDADTVIDDGCLWADDDGDAVPAAARTGVGTAETLCDGLDNDFDGVIDDGCAVPELAPDECNGEDDDGDTVIDDGACIDEPPAGDDTGVDPGNIAGWVLQNVGANASIIGGPDFCWKLSDINAPRNADGDIVPGKPGFSTLDVNEQCIAITSTTPGETSISARYDGQTTNTLVKEWDKFIDTVILKAADLDSITIPGMGTQKMPKDADGDGVRDADDEHLMDHNGETQEHPVIFDEASKSNRSGDGPIQLIDVVHGQHCGTGSSCPGALPSAFLDHPTEGAVVLAFIDSPRGCTYFTDPLNQAYFGTAVVGMTDWRGFMIGPKLWPSGAQFNAEALGKAAAAGLSPGKSNNGPNSTAVASLLGVYVDTLCEEQAVITFKVGYPNFVQSVPEIPAPEMVRINWTTIEMAKQPQIRWAGEEIVLEKRWALPGEWYPEPGAGIDNDGDTLINEDPLDDDGDGLINEEFGGTAGVDDDNDANEDGTHAIPGFGNCSDGLDNDGDTTIDSVGKAPAGVDPDVSCAKFTDEDLGTALTEDNDKDCVGAAPTNPAHPGVPPADPLTCVYGSAGCPICETAGGIDEDGPDSCPAAGLLVKYSKLGGPGGLISGLPDTFPVTASDPNVVWTTVDADCVSRALYSSEDPGAANVEATLTESLSAPINKHAFLVYYIKLYQVKLTNIPLTDDVGREFHNAGIWGGEDPITSAGVTAETLNVSQDALARVQVKGWMRTADNSARGAVCIDMDGDGDGIDDDADTLLNEDPKDTLDNDGDTKIDEDIQVPGEPYPLAQYEAGCPDPNDEILDHGYWILPDDIEALAGPHPDRLATWDVMSEPDVSASDLIGYKSTLDSHDDVLRRVVDCVVLRVRPTGEVVSDFTCTRKTVDPDGKITDADAIMPPLKILAQILDDDDGTLDVGESGFLKMADKGADVGILSAYQRAEIAASPFIPQPVNNGGYDWDSWGFYRNSVVQGPYEFFDILTKHEVLDALNRPFIRNFAFYTDNRGLGYFFVNGDFNLTFDDCLRQQLSGTPDCKPGAVVGKTDITVIGDYPYFRPHPAIESNLVIKTWTWKGFKSVTAEKIDATHTKVIAHLRDRDGYCKWDVAADPTKANSVIFSPSINEVQHEWIEFLLNTHVGFMRDVSPNSLYLGTGVNDQHSIIDLGMPRREILKIQDHVHVPLAKVRSTGLEEGRIFEAERAALARAEDVRVLAFYGKSAAVDPKYTDPAAPDECQAWVLIEHPADLTPNVSVVFHDPEGQIDRHYPTSQFVSVLVQGWNDSCYTGPAMDIEEALTDAGLIEADGTSHVLAVYRFTNDTDQAFDHWFPGRPDIEDTITTISPFDQLFLLMDSPMSWAMDVVADTTGQKDTQLSLIENWNSVCYAGADKAPEEAAASINNSLVIMYTLAQDQTWRRYVPNRTELTNIITLNQYTSVFVLMTGPGTWVFDP